MRAFSACYPGVIVDRYPGVAFMPLTGTTIRPLLMQARKSFLRRFFVKMLPRFRRQRQRDWGRRLP
jgi:hypothetical protein